MTSSDNRYQYQPLLIRVYRWLRYKPLYAIGAVLHLFFWTLDGRPTEDLGRRYRTRRARALGIWTEWMSMASYRMQHYYSLEEMIQVEDVEAD